jgi:6-pyruvoyl-tetrahydropterin synthase
MINISLDKLVKEKYDEIALNSILNNSNDYTTETLFNVYLLLRDREKNISPEKLKMLDEKFNNEGGIENYTKEYLKQKKEAEEEGELFKKGEITSKIISNNSQVLYPTIEKLFVIFKIVNVFSWLLIVFLLVYGVLLSIESSSSAGMPLIGSAILISGLMFFQYLAQEFVKVQVDIAKNTHKTNELLQKLLYK